tara:strand:+ start:927 stop:1577 length:651 start_codon:yes stop_codon:yes gene_type:complete
MNKNLFEAQYNVTKKSKLKLFYESNKVLIYSFIFVLIFSIAAFTYYVEDQEKKRFLLSENYVKAKILLSNGKNDEAFNLLKNIVVSNDDVYSSLALFMILNQNLITDQKEISSLFNNLLEKNKFNEEMRNLILYKKALYNSNYVSESILLDEIKPLLNKKESVWRVHALLLLGEYFMSKNENLKAKDFYIEILNTTDLPRDLYNQAQLKLSLVKND